MEKQSMNDFIAILRKAKGYTQVVLAEKLGVSSKTISKWECGEGMPDISMLKPLSEILEVSVEELLCGKRRTQIKGSEQRAQNQLELIYKSIKTKFCNVSVICLGLGILILVLTLIGIVVGDTLGFVFVIVSSVMAVSMIVLQIININTTIASVKEICIGEQEPCLYVKSIRGVIYNFSYYIFAIVIAFISTLIIGLGGLV